MTIVDPDHDETLSREDPEPTARPTRRDGREEVDAPERVVPSTNVGGAAPSRGGDSGGDLPGTEDDLANLSEPEPPEASELDGFSVREGGLPAGSLDEE